MSNLEIIKSLAPIPSVLGAQNAVFIGPHPDDIEIAAGGTVQEFLKKKTQVSYIICTDGSSGSQDPEEDVSLLAKKRRQETLAAADYLGVEKVYFLDYPDGGDYRSWDLAKSIATVLTTIKPDIIFTTDPSLPSETHPDHIKCGEATKTAMFISSYYHIAKRNGLDLPKEAFINTQNRVLAFYHTATPNALVGFSEEIFEKKMNALACHKCQFDLEDKDVDESLEYGAIRGFLELKESGQAEGLKEDFAEEFFVLAPLHQHCFAPVMHF